MNEWAERSEKLLKKIFCKKFAKNEKIRIIRISLFFIKNCMYYPIFWFVFIAINISGYWPSDEKLIVNIVLFTLYVAIKHYEKLHFETNNAIFEIYWESIKEELQENVPELKRYKNSASLIDKDYRALDPKVIEEYKQKEENQKELLESYKSNNLLRLMPRIHDKIEFLKNIEASKKKNIVYKFFLSYYGLIPYLILVFAIMTNI